MYAPRWHFFRPHKRHKHKILQLILRKAFLFAFHQWMWSIIFVQQLVSSVCSIGGKRSNSRVLERPRSNRPRSNRPRSNRGALSANHANAVHLLRIQSVHQTAVGSVEFEFTIERLRGAMVFRFSTDTSLSVELYTL